MIGKAETINFVKYSNRQMSKLIIKYRDGGGSEASERLISDIVVEGHDFIMAFCHVEHVRRAFKIERIASLIEPTSGEIIRDVAAHFGVLEVKSVDPDEMLRAAALTTMTAEEMKRLRSKERSAFWQRYMYPVIASYYRRKLFTLFNNRCFKCGTSQWLEIDHHIPIVLGGHLVPGNMVALCSTCNNRKHDKNPASYYSSEELMKLDSILRQEPEVLDFMFDNAHWEEDPKGYLLRIGLDEKLIDAVLTNPAHPFYIAPARCSEDSSDDITITIDVSSMDLFDHEDHGNQTT